jgi:hypothetical protein
MEGRRYDQKHVSDAVAWAKLPENRATLWEQWRRLNERD